MRIEYLADNPWHLPTLAAWHHAEFGYLNPATTKEQRVERLVASAQKDKLPLTFVALSGDYLLGSASLLPKTITHPHLSPWLSSVYVASEYRGAGIASSLTRHVVEAAAVLEIDKLYLFTPKSEALYARLGWTTIEYTDYAGLRIAIMEIAARL